MAGRLVARVGTEAGRPSPIVASMTPPTPVEAWDRLRLGNTRFVEGESIHPNQGAERRASLVEVQNPFAVIFGCSDSRLAAEIIFDVGLGDIFVVRSAGHVIDTAILGSLEYAVAVLDVPLVVVLGHDYCGAVSATVEFVDTGVRPPGHIGDLVEAITPSVLDGRREGVDDLNALVEEHVRQTTARLVEASGTISSSVDSGGTAVVGLTYHLAEGQAELVSGFGLG